MSLKDRLEAKRRRRVIVPIQLSDPSADQHDLIAVAGVHAQAEARDPQDEAEVAELQRQMDEAEERVKAHHVDVELQSLPRDEWEAAQAQWVTESGDSLDWKTALPHLLAASCVDEDLRDADWWAGVLAGDAWTEGDIDALRVGLMHLNITAPDPRLPKG